MTEAELDEILTFWWPSIVRAILDGDAEEWLQGFVLSIARKGKNAAWQPSRKQQRLMRRLVSQHRTTSAASLQLIEE